MPGQQAAAAEDTGPLQRSVFTNYSVVLSKAQEKYLMGAVLLRGVRKQRTVNIFGLLRTIFQIG